MSTPHVEAARALRAFQLMAVRRRNWDLARFYLTTLVRMCGGYANVGRTLVGFPTRPGFWAVRSS